MGWTPINYACGHRGEEQMYGKISSRDARANYLGQYDCPACRGKQGEERGCKKLRGTEKQRAWAGDIRSDYLRRNSGLSAAECARLPIASGIWIDNRQSLDIIRPAIIAPAITQAEEGATYTV